jgi:hypothetical protein
LKKNKVTHFSLYCQKDQFTPQCYLAQPEWRTHSTHWPYIRLNPRLGEGSLDAIHQFINVELATLLQIDTEQATDSHFINQELAELRLEVEPYFVLIPDAFVHRSEDNIPDYISQHWPSLNQLLLLERNSPIPALSPY